MHWVGFCFLTLHLSGKVNSQKEMVSCIMQKPPSDPDQVRVIFFPSLQTPCALRSLVPGPPLQHGDSVVEEGNRNISKEADTQGLWIWETASVWGQPPACWEGTSRSLLSL